MANKKRPEFEVYHHWRYLRQHYSLEDSFDFFGPYKGASIFPKFVDDHTIEVSMPLVPSNTNYVGTHFGGSLYSMTDPFFMFLIMEHLGSDYIVWDKSAKIEFVRPGTGTVKAIFHISPEELNEIRRVIAQDKKTTRYYEVAIIDEEGQTVARVTKELYIRQNPHKK